MGNDLTNKSIILNGEIRNLSNKDKTGWNRQEIIVEYNIHLKYPKIRDKIILKDINNRYELDELSFIHGANRDGWVCLGQPGRLKDWFIENSAKNNQKVKLLLVSSKKKIFRLLL